MSNDDAPRLDTDDVIITLDDDVLNALEISGMVMTGRNMDGWKVT
eukprot:CAMPEP_0119545296 /NCGR_PEP_ID=MMETSP1352-20130426/70_1 /TAXON_ID=265584 /ORGANISM="Stauroneis constricta, Strain CCMP1120" /LENGTH=44 /DNA_ID= /DNA_START= /DNA_END= /DNA_ORIENTATION=